MCVRERRSVYICVGGIGGFGRLFPRAHQDPSAVWWQKDASREGTDAASGFWFPLSLLYHLLSHPPYSKTFLPFSPHLPQLLFRVVSFHSFPLLTLCAAGILLGKKKKLIVSRTNQPLALC